MCRRALSCEVRILGRQPNGGTGAEYVGCFLSCVVGLVGDLVKYIPSFVPQFPYLSHCNHLICPPAPI